MLAFGEGGLPYSQLLLPLAWVRALRLVGYAAPRIIDLYLDERRPLANVESLAAILVTIGGRIIQ